jgi:hypothetical protein
MTIEAPEFLASVALIATAIFTVVHFRGRRRPQ